MAAFKSSAVDLYSDMIAYYYLYAEAFLEILVFQITNLWINNELHDIALADKVVGGAQHKKVQVMGYVVFLVNSFYALALFAWNLTQFVIDFSNFTWRGTYAKGLVQIVQAFIGFSTGLFYFLTVESYNFI